MIPFYYAPSLRILSQAGRREFVVTPTVRERPNERAKNSLAEHTVENKNPISIIKIYIYKIQIQNGQSQHGSRIYNQTVEND